MLQTRPNGLLKGRQFLYMTVPPYLSDCSLFVTATGLKSSPGSRQPSSSANSLPTSTGFFWNGEWPGAVKVPDIQMALENNPALKQWMKVHIIITDNSVCSTTTTFEGTQGGKRHMQMQLRVRLTWHDLGRLQSNECFLLPTWGLESDPIAIGYQLQTLYPGIGIQMAQL